MFPDFTGLVDEETGSVGSWYFVVLRGFGGKWLGQDDKTQKMLGCHCSGSRTFWPTTHFWFRMGVDLTSILASLSELGENA